MEASAPPYFACYRCRSVEPVMELAVGGTQWLGAHHVLPREDGFAEESGVRQEIGSPAVAFEVVALQSPMTVERRKPPLVASVTIRRGTFPNAESFPSLSSEFLAENSLFTNYSLVYCCRCGEDCLARRRPHFLQMVSMIQIKCGFRKVCVQRNMRARVCLYCCALLRLPLLLLF